MEESNCIIQEYLAFIEISPVVKEDMTTKQKIRLKRL